MTLRGRSALAAAAVLLLAGAGYLWFARGAAMLLDFSWVGCL